MIGNQIGSQKVQLRSRTTQGPLRMLQLRLLLLLLLLVLRLTTPKSSNNKRRSPCPCLFLVVSPPSFPPALHKVRHEQYRPQCPQRWGRVLHACKKGALASPPSCRPFHAHLLQVLLRLPLLLPLLLLLLGKQQQQQLQQLLLLLLNRRKQDCCLPPPCLSELLLLGLRRGAGRRPSCSAVCAPLSFLLYVRRLLAAVATEGHTLNTKL